MRDGEHYHRGAFDSVAPNRRVSSPSANTPVWPEVPLDKKPGALWSHERMQRLIGLLHAAVSQLHDREHPAHVTLLKAASLLRQQIDPQAAAEVPDGRGRLLAWQAREVRAYLDSHIAGPVLVADLCALVRLSEAHFSRVFRRTFGKSPHAFVIGRRVELAAQYMLTSDASLSDIALRCGFTDQPHLCKHFRRTTGQSPAVWRRAQIDSTGKRLGMPDFGWRGSLTLSSKLVGAITS